MSLHRNAATMAVRRRPARPRQRQAGPVTTIRVNPLAWQLALFLASGDRRRLVVCDPSAVLVVNSPRPR